ncbi:replication initiator protein A [Deinococcus deserti]|uniref:Putative plasmid replication initiator protein n=1 Tax=Deinococcus deserti (strain DSM 17065 / CIP 109153 / LMG 22923 / VCD115) TaxID=546414 RepID=C1D1V8_DEIDV|nr:replication initiator protein A [Deinococcus deserti]ACO47397.2 putative plasmid replication initiator protein [Deinococcus deserti VCD115]
MDKPSDLRIFEMDLTRSGIISVQRDMPTELTSWVSDYSISGNHYRVEATARYGRPHGTDNDVMVALQSLFLRNGCPEHNRVSLTANQLLLQSYGRNTSKDYQNLRASLMRLAGTNWTLYQNATDPKTRRTKGITTTNFMFTLEMEDHSASDHDFSHRDLDDSSHIIVKFADTFAQSIRLGFFQMLDVHLMQRLGHTNARSLYRVIQGHRIQPDGSLAPSLDLRLADWMSACGLETDRLDNARRILDAAHRRLLDEDFLQDVELTGRGRNATLHYAFQGVPEPSQVEQLMAHRVTRPVAETLAADYPERVTPAISVIEERLKGGWRPRSVSAALVDAIRNPEKWGYTPPPSRHGPKAASVPQPALHSPQEAEPLTTPRETARTLLRLRLGRDCSLFAQHEIDQLSDAGMQALIEALHRPKEEGLPLVSSILNHVTL